MPTDLCGGGVGGDDDSSAGMAAAPPVEDAAAEALLPENASLQPTSAVGLVFRAVTFYSRATLLLLSYMPVYVKGGFAYNPDLDGDWRMLHEQGARSLAALINELKGFHVKLGQVIATRSDLFPAEYSVRLAHMVDSVSPLPFSAVRNMVEHDLLGGLALEEAFEAFDEVPLGSASIAQVHRAKLRGGREVAVKVQRPHVEPRLMSDIQVIRNFTFLTQKLFPVDYYAVTRELEEQLKDEFDFIEEASAMDRVADALTRGGRRAPVVVPRSIPGLVSRRVLCMDFVPGVPLSRLRSELQRRGLDVAPGSAAERAYGRRLLSALSDAFAVMIFEEGFFHADPHPGNVFVMPDFSTALIDFGQTKRLGYRFRRQLAEMIVLISDLEGIDLADLTSRHFAILTDCASGMGVEFLPEAKPSCSTALAFWLFDTARSELPGDYDLKELSPRNPTRDVASFPKEFVLLCRTTLLIRGLAMRLGVRWSLASAWREAAMRVLDGKPAEIRTPAETAARVCRRFAPRLWDAVTWPLKRWRIAAPKLG